MEAAGVTEDMKDTRVRYIKMASIGKSDGKKFMESFFDYEHPLVFIGQVFQHFESQISGCFAIKGQFLTPKWPKPL